MLSIVPLYHCAELVSAKGDCTQFYPLQLCKINHQSSILFVTFDGQVGDSIVRKARETLENAIKLVNENEEWKCHVVYGDTDSLFVVVPGRNLQQAFKIGEEIRDAVTAANPKPIKLKLEKVIMFFQFNTHVMENKDSSMCCSLCLLGLF